MCERVIVTVQQSFTENRHLDNLNSCDIERFQKWTNVITSPLFCTTSLGAFELFQSIHKRTLPRPWWNPYGPYPKVLGLTEAGLKRVNQGDCHHKLIKTRCTVLTPLQFTHNIV